MQIVLRIDGELNILDEHIRKINAKKVMLVCGSSIRFLRYDSYFREMENRLGINVVRFSDFTPNPTYDSVVKGVDIFNEEQCDMIVAVGGGSAMDVAKCIKLFANVEEQSDNNSERHNRNINYLKCKIVPNDIPFIAIPTTAGTGSEATRFAVIYYEGEKVSVEHESCLPMLVVMDSDVLSDLPIYHKKAAALDTLCHAIESFWSVNSNDESKGYSREAIRLLIDNIDYYLGTDILSEFRHKGKECDNSCHDGDGMADHIKDTTVYGHMQHAAYLAGKAINITKTTAGHAMCYKLTTLYGIAHGHAAALCVSKLFPYMIKHTDDCCDARGKAYLDEMFAELADALGCCNVEDASVIFDKFPEIFGLDVPSVNDEDIDILVNSVNVDRLKNNPVNLNEAAIDELYHHILKKG